MCYRQTTKSCLSHSLSVWPRVPPCNRRFQEVAPKSRLGNNPHGTLDITELVMILGYFGPTCAEPAPTSSLTSAPAPINPLPHPLFDSISHLRTPAAQARLLSPAHTRQPNGKHSRSSTPAQRCTGASQIISTPSGAPAQPCKHARLVQVRGKARCRLEPAVTKRDVKSQDCETHCKRS